MKRDEWPPQGLTIIYGYPASGKSLLALLAAKRVSSAGGTCCYISTEGQPRPSELCRVSEAYDADSLINEIIKSRRVLLYAPRPQLLVVDSITAPVYPLINLDPIIGYSKLDSICSLLLTTSLDFPVLATAWRSRNGGPIACRKARLSSVEIVGDEIVIRGSVNARLSLHGVLAELGVVHERSLEGF